MDSSHFFSEISHSSSSDASKKETESVFQNLVQDTEKQEGTEISWNLEVNATASTQETPTEAPQRTSEIQDPTLSVRESQRPPNSFKSRPSQHHYEVNSSSSFSSRAMQSMRNPFLNP
ncbi:hypothetical protein BG005_008224 [Podila minutissima]|nr:hypothetical protein BG005_008224 [Podila minutissima]